MYKAGAFLLILLLGTSILLAAQEDDDPAYETDWDDYTMDLYTRGDQTFIISMGTIFPTIFINQGEIVTHNLTPPVGGSGSLAYCYFLNSNVFLGGDLTFQFINTLGGNALYLIPLGIRAGYQFNVWKLEFPILAGVGMAWHRYIGMGHYGLYAKAGFGGYFRATASWSFGINASWFWYPQWTEDKQKNIDGNFVELVLSARYHF